MMSLLCCDVPEDLQCKDFPASKPSSLRYFGDFTTLLLTALAGEEAVPGDQQY